MKKSLPLASLALVAAFGISVCGSSANDDSVDKDGTTLLANRYHTHLCTARYTTHTLMPEIQYYTTCARGGQ